MYERPYQDYFDLQLRVALSYARLGQMPRAVAIGQFTNLRKRLGLMGASGVAAWRRLLQCASSEADHQDLLEAALDLHDRRAQCFSSPFGCFSYDPPDAEGVIRIHFMPDERHRGDSPLSDARLPERRAELRALTADLRQRHPDARHVRGRSWLYNLDAYKRIFPAEYVASISRPTSAVNLTGSSTWGQALNYQGRVKQAVRDHVLSHVSLATLETPWQAFPLIALVADAPVQCFAP